MTTDLRFPVVVTTSWDDGHVLDLELADLLSRYGLPGTFYIAPRNRELEPGKRLTAGQIAHLAQDFEIGGHTLTHARLPGLPDELALAEIVDGKVELEDTIGRSLAAFCYPRGEYRTDQISLVADAGFRLGRTIDRHRVDPAPAPYETPTTFHAYRHLLDGPAAWSMSNHSPRRAAHWFANWDAWAIAMFDSVLQTGGTYHLWGHSWEIAARGDWARLERVLDHISCRDGVTYVDNGGLVVGTG